MRVALIGPYVVDVDRTRGSVESSVSMLVRGLADLVDVEPYVAFRPGLGQPMVQRAEGERPSTSPELRGSRTSRCMPASVSRLGDPPPGPARCRPRKTPRYAWLTSEHHARMAVSVMGSCGSRFLMTATPMQWSTSATRSAVASGTSENPLLDRLFRAGAGT